MPGKGASEGFKERNTTVGSTWSSYTKDEQEVFTPRLFERLCIATSEAYALTQTPLGIPAASQPVDSPTTTTFLPPPASALISLTKKDLDKYVPIFERLVNVRKVALDMHGGRLWRHSGKTRLRDIEQLMMQEISKIVRQVYSFPLFCYNTAFVNTVTPYFLASYSEKPLEASLSPSSCMLEPSLS